MDLAEYERIIPNAKVQGLNDQPITFLTPNSHVAWRVQTLYTKETDTIQWLKNMQPGETLFDIGANIGQYSLLAAQKGVNVHAFEPEAQNFALLVRNIAINSAVLGGRLTPWPVALSDHISLDILHLSGIVAGGSCHAYGDSRDFRGKEHKFPNFQGSCATTLDHFVAKYSDPEYIKLDVDGFEHLVIQGGEALLERKKVKSVLIEINTAYPEHMEYVLPKMAEFGFEYDASQADESRRKEGPFTGVGNIVFYRD
jgi:FkbM family methyltransferase